MFRNRLIITFYVVLLLGSALMVTPAYAAGIVVNTATDEDANNANCSLREAVTAANTNAAYNGCATGIGSDVITFTDGITTIPLDDTLPHIADPAGLTINGGGDITITGSDIHRIFWVEGGTPLTLANLTVAHGACPSCSGGGIYSSGGTVIIANSTFSGNSQGISVFDGAVTIMNSIFSGNSSSYGGGVSSVGGTLTITNSTFSGNTADNGGGGSGVYTGGTATITNSTFSGNSGGRGSIYTDGTTSITNSTFSGNASSSTNNVGGVYNQGTLTIRNSTFSGNSNTGFGGGGDIYQLGASSTLNLYNNILANSAGGGNCVAGPGTAGAGTVAGNNNLIEDAATATACGFTNGVNGNIIGSDPDLGALSGSPAYFPLNSGSLAIDAGDDTVCAAAPVNHASQNGVTRPQGTHCDIGSFELPTLTVLSILRASPNPTNAASVDFTVTFSKPVTGVDSADFALTVMGITGASVTGVSGSGTTWTVTVNTGSGSGTIRLDLVDNDTIVDAGSNPLGGVGTGNGSYITGQAYTLSRTLTVLSAGVYDGLILESTETSGVGGSLNNTANTFRLGDDASNRQYRSILSFSTAALPDNATITSAVLTIKQNGVAVGTNPFTVLGNLLVDIRQGTFGAAALELADFSSTASASAVGAFNSTPVSGVYRYTLNSAARGFINLTGPTQFRLRFGLDDNNNHVADCMNFLSGNFTSGQPQLTITYTVP